MDKELMMREVELFLNMRDPYENPYNISFIDNHPTDGTYVHQSIVKLTSTYETPNYKIYLKDSFQSMFTDFAERAGIIIVSDDPDDVIYRIDSDPELIEEYLGIIAANIRRWLSAHEIKNTEGQEMILKYDWEHTRVDEESDFSPLTINKDLVDLFPEELRATIPAKYLH